MPINDQKKNAFSYSIACVCIAVFTSAFLLNRAFIIGSVTGLIFLLYTYKKIKISKKIVTINIGVIMSLITLLTVYVKSDSSLGRLFIYKISWQMFYQNPWTGIGWNGFQKEYNLYQAAFFETEKYTDKEFLLADNTFYAFNDYWQFIIETGFFGGLCLLLFIISMVILTIKRLRNSEDPLLKLIVACMLIISVAAFFTHVFEKRLFQVITTVGLCYLIGYNSFQKMNSLPRTISYSLLFTVTIAMVYFNDIYYFSSHNRLRQAKILSETGYLLESKKVYEELYPYLKNDIGFLKEYYQIIETSSDQEKKLRILHEISKTYTNNLTFLKFGQVYKEIGETELAEKALLKAVYMVPNRVVPKEILYRFYLAQKKHHKAEFWSTQILNMPIKIPSKKIEDIKQKLVINQSQ